MHPVLQTSKSHFQCAKSNRDKSTENLFLLVLFYIFLPFTTEFKTIHGAERKILFGVLKEIIDILYYLKHKDL